MFVTENLTNKSSPTLEYNRKYYTAAFHKKRTLKIKFRGCFNKWTQNDFFFFRFFPS